MFDLDGPFVGRDNRPEDRERRFMLVGGPWGPMYPMGVFPQWENEEEADPNP
jgi:hypothetical protein